MIACIPMPGHADYSLMLDTERKMRAKTSIPPAQPPARAKSTIQTQSTAFTYFAAVWAKTQRMSTRNYRKRAIAHLLWRRPQTLVRLFVFFPQLVALLAESAAAYNSIVLHLCMYKRLLRQHVTRTDMYATHHTSVLSFCVCRSIQYLCPSKHV